MALDLVLGGQIPPHIAANRQRLNLNRNASANLPAAGFAVLIYKGQQWSVRHQQETILLEASAGTGHDGRPLPAQPVPTLDIVICGVADAVSKAWYRDQYVEGGIAPPDCASINGQVPDAGVPDPQNESCKLCQWDKFGTATTGTGRGKACKDYKRIAFVPAGDEENENYGGPMMLRIPPTSLQNFRRYGQDLARHGTDMSEVVTRLSFQKGLSYPVIEFNAVGWVEADPYRIVVDWASSDEVKRMLEDSLVETRSMGESAPSTLAQLPPRPTGRTNAPAAAPPAPGPTAVRQPPPAPVSPFAAAKAQAQASKPMPPPSAAAAEKPRGAVPLDDPNRPRNRPPAPPVRKAEPAKGNGNDVPTVVKGLPDEMASIIDGMLGESNDEEE